MGAHVPVAGVSVVQFSLLGVSSVHVPDDGDCVFHVAALTGTGRQLIVPVCNATASSVAVRVASMFPSPAKASSVLRSRGRDNKAAILPEPVDEPKRSR